MIVVEQDNVSSIFGDPSTGNTRSETTIGAFESRWIFGSVFCHRYNLSIGKDFNTKVSETIRARFLSANKFDWFKP